MLAPLGPAVGSTGLGESVWVTERSAIGPTVVVSVSLLFVALGSAVVELTVAVLLITVPAGTASLTLTTNVRPRPELAGSEENVQVTVPVPPGAGVVQLVLPKFSKETKVVPTGIMSVSVTPWASLGPRLVMLIS